MSRHSITDFCACNASGERVNTFMPSITGHLHQAHTAIGRHRELLVIAETRNVDARFVRHLDQHGAFRRLERLPVDFNGDRGFVHG
jgi:hypothetical protein